MDSSSCTVFGFGIGVMLAPQNEWETAPPLSPQVLEESVWSCCPFSSTSPRHAWTEGLRRGGQELACLVPPMPIFYK